MMENFYRRLVKGRGGGASGTGGCNKGLKSLTFHFRTRYSRHKPSRVSHRIPVVSLLSGRKAMATARPLPSGLNGLDTTNLLRSTRIGTVSTALSAGCVAPSATNVSVNFLVKIA